MPNMTEEELAERLATNPDLSMVIGADGVTTVALDAGKRKSPEADFEKAMIALARTLGYKVLQFRKARQRKGGQDTWVTPFGADGVGFPDASFYHPISRVSFYVEFKSNTGRLTPAQIEWIEILRKCDNNVFVWRPRDIDVAIETITGCAERLE